VCINCTAANIGLAQYWQTELKLNFFSIYQQQLVRLGSKIFLGKFEILVLILIFTSSRNSNSSTAPSRNVGR
jgi:hypothetical protein